MYVRGGGGGAEGLGGCSCDVCVCVERKVNLKQRCVLLVYICPSVCFGRNRYEDIIKPMGCRFAINPLFCDITKSI